MLYYNHRKGKEKKGKVKEMTKNMMMKVEEAKKMMAHVAELEYLKDGKYFCPSEYDGYRYQWEEVTPSWGTLKKYAEEIGLVAEDVPFEWHSDGSMLAELCGMKEGEVFYHKMYYFA